MVTTKQVQALVRITSELRRKEQSIVELQRNLGMKRSTLIYYLKILEEKGYLEKGIQENKQGSPVILKFNEGKYRADQEDYEKKFQQERKELLNHPLTFEILELLRQDSKLTKKELHGKTTDYFRKASHLSWLINEGLIEQEFSITEKGKRFLEECRK